MNAQFIVEKTATGYSAYLDNLPVYTTGSSMSELKSNMLEAYNLYLEETNQPVIQMNDLPNFGASMQRGKKRGVLVTKRPKTYFIERYK